MNNENDIEVAELDERTAEKRKAVRKKGSTGSVKKAKDGRKKGKGSAKKPEKEESLTHAIIRKMIFSISLGIFCYALSGLLVLMWGYYSSQRDYNRLNKDLVEIGGKTDPSDNDIKPGTDGNNKIDIDNTEKKAPYIDIKIDEEKWKAINEDYAFYLYIPGTKIQYPVVQGKDNNHYLRYTYENKENTAGAIAIDYRTKKDPYFENFNIIMSGHNRQDGTMFSDLAKYKDESFRNENPYIYIIYNGKEYVFEFFAFYTMKPVALCYNPSASMKPYIGFIDRNNDYKKRFEIKPDDKIITLYTCNEDSSMRYVSHAKLIQIMDLR